MNQTKLESLLETCINIAIGFCVSLTFWTFVVVPVWHLPVTMMQNIHITLAFTVLAIARGYVVRRFFNAQIHKAIHRWVRGVRRWKRSTPRIPECYGDHPGKFSYLWAERDCIRCPREYSCEPKR